MNFAELKKLAQETSSASLSDAMWADKHQHYMRDIIAQTPDKVVFGQAVTVRCVAAREDSMDDVTKKTNGDRTQAPFEVAMEMTGEGKVMVVEVPEHYTHACFGGDVKFSRLDNLKTEGLITNGNLRDKGDLTKMHFGVYSRGFTPRSGTSVYVYAYENQTEITCGGALVRPGDYIFGDDDGVVVIPEHRIEAVMMKSIWKERIDAFVRQEIKKDGVNPGTYYPITKEIKERYAQASGYKYEEIGFGPA